MEKFNKILSAFKDGQSPRDDPKVEEFDDQDRSPWRSKGAKGNGEPDKKGTIAGWFSGGGKSSRKPTQNGSPERTYKESCIISFLEAPEKQKVYQSSWKSDMNGLSGQQKFGTRSNTIQDLPDEEDYDEPHALDGESPMMKI
jgi:hypothetical protein